MKAEYSTHGDMENRIKEQQLDLYADRTSCHKWWANQFRLLLSSLAYILSDHLRRTTLQNTRRTRLHLSSSCPHQELFAGVAARLE